VNKYSEQDLIQNIENKIATCVDCRMILSDDAIESYEVTLRGRDKSGNPKVKTKLKCGYCGGGIKMRTEDRAHSIHYKTTTQGAMGSPDRPYSDSVTRIMDSPWGPIRMQISARSFFAPFVTVNGKHSAPIKRLIDDEFGDDAVIEARGLMPGIDAGGYWTFVHKLKAVVAAIHRDPNTPLVAEVA
jgi:hypothetical protein